MSVVTSTALMGMVVSASPAHAHANGCENLSHEVDWFNYDKAAYTGCLEIWGDGRTVDNLEQWFEMGRPLGVDTNGDMPPTDIRYVMNFDYFVAPGVVGHTDTIRSPFYSVDCSSWYMAPCAAPNSQFLWNGRFHWGDYRPDILGPNKGYGQVCAIVDWKTSQHDTWTPLTGWKCFRVGD